MKSAVSRKQELAGYTGSEREFSMNSILVANFGVSQCIKAISVLLNLLNFQRRDLVEGVKPVPTLFFFLEPETVSLLLQMG